MSYGYPHQRRGLRLLPILIGIVMIGFTMLSQCQEGPFGRKQIVALNPEQEKALGAQAFEQVLQQEKLVTRGPVVDAIRTITDRLTKAAANPRFLQIAKIPNEDVERMEWRIEVVESDQQNAFCLPGGKIVVYTGILAIAETDAGLSTVLGHEISHALAHHGAERMAHENLVQIGVMSVGGAAGDMSYEQRVRLMQVLNAGARFGILKYSRKHETEADHMGLLIMAAAGYDPQQSFRFWERMQHAGGKEGRPPEFMSTHPSHDTRIADLKGWMTEAMPLYEASAKIPTKRLPTVDGSPAMLP